MRHRRPLTRIVALALGAAALLTAAAWQRPSTGPMGFTPARASAHRNLEQRFLKLPSADRMRDTHRFLTHEPHLAGSPRDRELAEWTRDRFRDFGLEDVRITTHDVLLPWPEHVSVEMKWGDGTWHATMREDPIAGDSYTQAAPEVLGLPYHAYSASGDVVAPAFYAGSGNPSDYEWLAAQGIDVRGKIALVRYSMPYSYRGSKAHEAQRRGAAGILIYSDPADDGYAKGAVYPAGPWGPDSHIQRGGIVYDFLVPGDPLTPGWASLPGARRIPPAEAVSLPRILSAPMSHRDARVILESLGGPEVPRTWRGALPITYRAGPGPSVRLRVRSDDRVRPVWTVTGMIRGTDRPDDVVIVGNHRDAWIYGGVDPSSGSTALVELARGLGELTRSGWRPKRSILLASWDAEEFSLTSSTEWGEQHQAWLRKSAVAYLNVDSATSGPVFTASAVPALNRLIEEVALAVRDPATRLTIAARARDRLSTERGARPTGSPEDIVNNRLGSGSDYTVFLNHLGVPIADLTFDGPYGVYHSIYDNHNWVARFGDPGFRYHVAMVQLWGLLVLRLAEADVIPLDYEPYARRVEEFAAEVGRRWTDGGTGGSSDVVAEVRLAAAEMRAAARRANDRRAGLLARFDVAGVDRLNRQLISVERALLDPDGIPGRPWYRHLIYAPKFTYAPEVLPALAESVDGGDARRTRLEAQRLAAALRRAAAALDSRAPSP
jgi:N-acetylated-alpha-linked acidic dipeptidase